MQVLVVLKDGRLAYQRIFMFSHRDASKVSDFVTLQSISGAQIQMSPSHYVWGALTSHLRHSQNDAASASWRSLKAAENNGQNRQGSKPGEAVSEHNDADTNSSTSTAADSVTESCWHLLNSGGLWLEAFGDSQVLTIWLHSTLCPKILVGVVGLKASGSRLDMTAAPYSHPPLATENRTQGPYDDSNHSPMCSHCKC